MMPEPTLPVQDVERLKALKDLGLLDTKPEERFDRLTRLAQRVFGVQVAAIALVGAERAWFKSRVGLEASELPSSDTFCPLTLAASEMLVVEDSHAEAAYRHHPASAEMRFYAGYALCGPDGHKMGTFALWDSAPRRFVEAERELLRELACLAEHELNTLQLAQALQIQRQTEARIQVVMDSVADGVFMFDEDGVIESLNPAAGRMFAYEPGEVIGKSIKQLLPETSQSEPRVIGTGHEVVGRRKDGTLFPMELAVNLLLREDQQLFICVARDITDRKNAEERIKVLATLDGLTGLPNRLLFQDRLNQALALARRGVRNVAVMILDLDRFKFINDTLGYELSDQLLKSVAHRLSTCIREVDTFARLGADQFAFVLCEPAQPKDASKVAQRLLDVLATPFMISEQEVFVSASVGISVYPSDGPDSTALIQNAETAMYRAKEYRNSFQFYAPVMNEASAEKLSLESHLRKAIDRGELLLHYQPQVDLHSRQIVGAEALIRWQHPEMGLVPPGKFIPLAEETGLIVPITDWVLRTACEQNRRWRMDGHPPLRVSVNMSGLYLKQRNVVEMVSKVLAETGLDPAGLELELTESILMDNLETTIKTLMQLNDMGVQLSIDDFGTGYSSLSYLKRFPISTLKIDRSFVMDITNDQDDAAITTAIIALAHSLHLNVIAEGVETVDQLAFLHSKGCDEIQGYYFSKPLPVDAFTELLLSEKTLVM